MLLAALSFAVVGLAIFIATPSDEARYYLPLCVAVAIVAALIAREHVLAPDGWMARARFGIVLGLFVLVCIGLLYLAATAPARLVPPADRFVVATLGVVVGALGTIHLRRHRRSVTPLLLLVAIGFWTASVFVLAPARASSRVLEEVAAEFAPRLPPGADVWVVGPAIEAGKRSSLYYYLGRRTRAFSVDGKLPEVGTYAVMTGADLHSLTTSRPDHGYEVLLRVEHLGAPFMLCRRGGRRATPFETRPTNPQPSGAGTRR